MQRVKVGARITAVPGDGDRMLDRRTRSGGPTDSTRELTPGRATVMVAACTGVLATLILLGSAYNMYVFGALAATSLLGLVMAANWAVGVRREADGSTSLAAGRRPVSDRGSRSGDRSCSSIHTLAASLALAVAAVILFVWSLEFEAIRSGYAAATLAGGLSYAIFASRFQSKHYG